MNEVSGVVDMGTEGGIIPQDIELRRKRSKAEG